MTKHAPATPLPFTNATVQRLGYEPFANPNLRWEIRGYIAGTWFNVPFATQTQAQDRLTALLRSLGEEA